MNFWCPLGVFGSEFMVNFCEKILLKSNVLAWLFLLGKMNNQSFKIYCPKKLEIFQKSSLTFRHSHTLIIADRSSLCHIKTSSIKLTFCQGSNNKLVRYSKKIVLFLFEKKKKKKINAEFTENDTIIVI